MGDVLRGKTILLISPQSWDHLKISKHHYAIELARRGNTVFFLEPPRTTGSFGVRMIPIRDYPGIQRVEYRAHFPYKLRFHFRKLFDHLVLAQISKIVRKIAEPLDIVWCFEPNLYSDLRAFSAPFTIYHPVDVVLYSYQINVARSANIVFSVSETILRHFVSINVPSYLINHGLATPFANAANRYEPQEAFNKPGDGTARRTRVGYAGNLAHPAVNRPMLQRVITDHPEVDFHIWGPADAPLDATRDYSVTGFFRFLTLQSNVILHGEVRPDVLAEALTSVDCLVLCYVCNTPTFDCSNSHKVLEYLSTGRVIVSTPISYYQGRRDLLRITEAADGSDFADLLADTLCRLETFNTIEAQQHRRRFALLGTYEQRVNTISQRIGSMRLHRSSSDDSSFAKDPSNA